MKVIGLTGGIGSGKSTVARFLAEMGAEVVDLDKVGHETIRPGTAARERIVAEFGRDILDAEGEIDRARLGKVVFGDKKALERLNAIVHPAIDSIVMGKLEEFRRRGVKVVVLEAAAMLEAGRGSQVDELWITTAPESTVLKRLAGRSGYSKEESQARIRSQMSDAERIGRADVIIDTDCPLEELREKVKAEWRRLLEREGSDAG